MASASVDPVATQVAVGSAAVGTAAAPPARSASAANTVAVRLARRNRSDPRTDPGTAGSALRDVSAGLTADPDPREPIGARDHLTARVRREEDEVAGPQLVLLALDADDPASLDDRVDLFLPVAAVVVLRGLAAGREVELVHGERAHAERRA